MENGGIALENSSLQNRQAQWYVLDRTANDRWNPEGERHRSMLRHICDLQEAYARQPLRHIWGSGAGCLDALWLAAQCDVDLLVLDGWPPSGTDRYMERLCLRSLFSVICPTIVLLQPGARFSPLPNAKTYIVESPVQLREITEKLAFA